MQGVWTNFFEKILCRNSNVINLSTYCIQYAQVQLFSPLTRRGGGGTIAGTPEKGLSPFPGNPGRRRSFLPRHPCLLASAESCRHFQQKKTPGTSPMVKFRAKIYACCHKPAIKPRRLGCRGKELRRGRGSPKRAKRALGVPVGWSFPLPAAFAAEKAEFGYFDVSSSLS